MGGDALPFPTQRLSPDRYKDVSQRLLALLSTHYALVCIPAPCPGKASYGDVDLLVAVPLADRPFEPEAQLGSRAVYRNGPTLSFEFEGHQADVISVSESTFDVARLFYSYGDVGMVVGMMLTAAGLKFGCKGLFLARAGHSQLQLSSDRGSILAWLGLSEAEWLAGFEDEQAVFAWLCSCRWFHPSLFRTRPESWKHNTRRALSARPMFVHFVQYVDSHTAADSNPTDRPTAAAMQANAVSVFGCDAAVAAQNAAEAKRHALKQRWNGVLVSARTGLEGKQLGLFMMACRQQATDDELLAMDVEGMERFMDNSYAQYVTNRSQSSKEEREESKQSVVCTDSR